MRTLQIALLGLGFSFSGLALADPAAIELLHQESDGTARVRLHRATGMARFVSVSPGSVALEGSTPAERAASFLARHGAAFGVADPSVELSSPDVATDALGHSRLTYRQVYRGLPVFAGTLRVHLDAQQRLTAANGTFVPAIDVDTRPLRVSETAASIAGVHVARQQSGSEVGFVAEASRLLVLRTGLLQGVAGRDHLVWEVEVANRADIREFVYVDAHTGKVVEQITGIHPTVERTIHEPSFNDVVIWSEGDPLPFSTGDPANDDQVNGLIDFAADVYDLFLHLSGSSYPSWDGVDGTMHSIWNASFLGCPNASWNGLSTNYCDGVASDDVVAHEWAHAYTQATHGLIYKWQPGALNESYSDIFGEIIDFTNGDGTDAPDASRIGDACSVFGGSPPPGFEINAPLSIAGSYLAGGANFNPSPPLTATADVELVDDGDDEGGSASVNDGCQNPVGFTPGKIALIDRGNCNFSGKVLRAQNAGAVGVIIVNSSDGVFNMGGSNNSITIPSVMVGNADGAVIKAELGNGVNASISLAAATANTVRWLMGEDSFAFGGPIRDMWSPTCFGDPGKVSDLQYYCNTGDNGGVHINSGVPNHAFALLVDGGTYNGQTITSIGLTKAAHLYWRAMSVYQVEDSDFADHAAALAQSCTDLLGIDLADLTTGTPSGQQLDAADCTEVDRAMLAVEMADEPPCNFQPLLDPDTPPFDCGAPVFVEEFENAPAAWTMTNVGVYAEYIPRDWEWTPGVPEGGTGSAMFALDDIDLGNCVEGDDDQSGVMTMDSPVIALPGGAPTLAFDHYVATENLYDGGNLEISVNGGPFAPIAVGDFTFNAYNATMVSAEDGNTNPMAGEDAFTGSDGGKVAGSWGQSHVDLSAHATAGDSIRLRFDFGVDGCNGLIGWYVDNITVCTSAVAAGSVPDGNAVPGTPLTLGKLGGGQIQLDWEDSCVSADDDYEVYAGSVGDFTSHAPLSCSTAGATDSTFVPAAGDRYYLVVPRNAGREGSYGLDGEGNERPAAAASCVDQEVAGACD